MVILPCGAAPHRADPVAALLVRPINLNFQPNQVRGVVLFDQTCPFSRKMALAQLLQR
jgi:hypothetical protein